MRTPTRNRSGKTAISLASLLAFLFFVATTPIALAQSEWPVWPPKKPVPAPAPADPKKDTTTVAPGPTDPTWEGAGKAGSTTGKSTFAGISSGTLGWTAAIIGGVVLIGVAAGGGGGGSTSGH